MTVADSIKAQIDEAKHVMRRQMARIAELEAEVERLRSAASAHDVLKEIYLDPAAPQSLRTKAAGLALSVEKPRLAMTAYVGKEVTGEVIIPLADLIRRRRARQNALQGLPLGHPEYLKWIDRDHTDEPPGSDQRDGNGSNGDGSSDDH
jgi:hypothetical protein